MLLTNTSVLSSIPRSVPSLNQSYASVLCVRPMRPSYASVLCLWPPSYASVLSSVPRSVLCLDQSYFPSLNSMQCATVIGSRRSRKDRRPMLGVDFSHIAHGKQRSLLRDSDSPLLLPLSRSCCN